MTGHAVQERPTSASGCAAPCPRSPKRRVSDGLLDIDAIADAFWQLHLQHRTAWTHELDLRPFQDPF